MNSPHRAFFEVDTAGSFSVCRPGFSATGAFGPNRIIGPAVHLISPGGVLISTRFPLLSIGKLDRSSRSAHHSMDRISLVPVVRYPLRVIGAVALAAASGCASGGPQPPAGGSPAPDFSLPGADGKLHTLAENSASP